MTTELSYRNEGANVYAQNGRLVCIAVDPLDAEVLAGLLRWKVDVTPTPEPDPWPTEPLIVADRGGRVNRRGLFMKFQRDADYMDIAAAVGNEEPDDVVWAEDGDDTLTNVVPVRVVPVAEWEAMKSDHRTRSHLADGCHICAIVRATDALGVDL